MKKIILVTGGAGFIGSHLCEKLSQDNNNKVYSLDNYSTGGIENHVKNVEYISGSTVDIEFLVKIKPDYIYHLGEYSRVEQSFEDIKMCGNLIKTEFSQSWSLQGKLVRNLFMPGVVQNLVMAG